MGCTGSRESPTGGVEGRRGCGTEEWGSVGNTGGKWAIGQGGDAGGLFRHQFLFRILSMILRAPFQIVLL